MLFTTIASAFFLDPAAGGDLAALVRRAGVTGVAELDETNRRALGLHDPGDRAVGGSWGAFGRTWAIADSVGRLCCLQLYSSAGQYLAAARRVREHGAPEGSGPLQAYADDFRRACLALSPRAAFLDTQPHPEDEAWDRKQGSRGFVLQQAPAVSALDADALAGRYFSLLYLNGEMADLWTPGPPGYQRDEIPVAVGRLVFAGSGAQRMA